MKLPLLDIPAVLEYSRFLAFQKSGVRGGGSGWNSLDLTELLEYSQFQVEVWNSPWVKFPRFQNSSEFWTKVKLPRFWNSPDFWNWNNRGDFSVCNSPCNRLSSLHTGSFIESNETPSTRHSRGSRILLNSGIPKIMVKFWMKLPVSAWKFSRTWEFHFTLKPRQIKIPAILK